MPKQRPLFATVTIHQRQINAKQYRHIGETSLNLPLISICYIVATGILTRVRIPATMDGLVHSLKCHSDPMSTFSQFSQQHVASLLVPSPSSCREIQNVHLRVRFRNSAIVYIESCTLQQIHKNIACS